MHSLCSQCEPSGFICWVETSRTLSVWHCQQNCERYVHVFGYALPPPLSLSISFNLSTYTNDNQSDLDYANFIVSSQPHKLVSICNWDPLLLVLRSAIVHTVTHYLKCVCAVCCMAFRQSDAEKENRKSQTFQGQTCACNKAKHTTHWLYNSSDV